MPAPNSAKHLIHDTLTLPPAAMSSMTGRLRLPPAEGQNQSHGEGHADERRSAIGDERQGHALGRKQRNIDAHVDDRLQAEDDAQPAHGKRRKRIGLNLCPLQYAHDDEGEQHHQADAGDQPNSSPTTAKVKSVWASGRILLRFAAAGARAQQAAILEGLRRRIDLKRVALVGIEEAVDARGDMRAPVS